MLRNLQIKFVLKDVKSQKYGLKINVLLYALKVKLKEMEFVLNKKKNAR